MRTDHCTPVIDRFAGETNAVSADVKGILGGSTDSRSHQTGSGTINIVNLHLLIGWIAMLLGAASGAGIGLFFHREDWAGGYSSLRRRMIRLGHISFFGIGFLNFLFAMTLAQVSLPEAHVRIASAGFLIAVVAMPLNCFLTAWKKPFRHLFAIPVLAVVAGIAPILAGWPST